MAGAGIETGSLGGAFAFRCLLFRKRLVFNTVKVRISSHQHRLIGHSVGLNQPSAF
jgi:hypothetical protein